MKGVRLFIGLEMREEVDIPNNPVYELAAAGFELVPKLGETTPLNVAVSTTTFSESQHFVVIPFSTFQRGPILFFGDVMLWLDGGAPLTIEDTIKKYRIFFGDFSSPMTMRFKNLAPRKPVYYCWKCGSPGLEFDKNGCPRCCASCGAAVDAKGKSMMQHMDEHLENINPFQCIIYPNNVRELIEKGDL